MRFRVQSFECLVFSKIRNYIAWYARGMHKTSCRSVVSNKKTKKLIESKVKLENSPTQMRSMRSMFKLSFQKIKRLFLKEPYNSIKSLSFGNEHKLSILLLNPILFEFFNFYIRKSINRF